MAFQMHYTTFQEAEYPQSYWRLGWYQQDRNGAHARVRFDCYYDQNARESNSEKNVLESKNYLITGDDFTAIFDSEADVCAALYSYAKNCPEGPPPAVGEEDTRVSFFETSIDV